MEEIIDSVAERIRSIGHYAEATLQEFMNLTHLTEKTGEKNDSIGFIKDLLEDHESIIIYLRENIDRFANDWCIAIHCASTLYREDTSSALSDAFKQCCHEYVSPMRHCIRHGVRRGWI